MNTNEQVGGTFYHFSNNLLISALLEYESILTSIASTFRTPDAQAEATLGTRNF